MYAYFMPQLSYSISIHNQICALMQDSNMHTFIHEYLPNSGTDYNSRIDGIPLSPPGDN